MSSRTKKFAALGAAAVTTAGLTVAVVPDSNSEQLAQERLLKLLADIRPFGTDPSAIPDLTGGLGSQGYDLAQQIADQLIRLIVENVNLSALADAAGLSPEDLVNDLLGGALNDVLGGLLGSSLGGLPVPVASALTPLLQAVLTQAVGNAGLAAVLNGILAPALGGGLNSSTLGGLFDDLGLDLSDPLNLSNLNTPGINIVTTGPLFTLLKLLGVDVGWVPALPDSVADEINGTPYLTLPLTGTGGLLDSLDLAALTTALQLGGSNIPLSQVLDALGTPVAIRLIPVVGVGLGAFAAGAAYQQVVEDLPNQPGGSNGEASLLGSYTVLPMILLLNPGRANGGPLARMYPLFRLAGIDTVTPETEVQSDGTGIPVVIPGVGDTGLTVGGANLIPIKLDIGIQNFPASDFAAWPNPVTLANNAAALLFPTYILRGADLTNISTVLARQILAQTPNTLPTDDHGLALNFYLTVPVKGAPILEPTYLLVDAINLLTGGSFNNPIGTALNPILESAGNLGYTDVERQLVDGHYEYVRTFDDTNVPTAFGSLPDVDWTKVPGDLFNLLQVGIQQAIDDGIEGEPTTNALKALLDLLGLDNVNPLGGSGFGLPNLTDFTDGLLGGALGSSLQSQSLQSESLKTTSFAPKSVESPSTGSGQTVTLTQTQTQDLTPSGEPQPAATEQDDTTPAAPKRPVKDLLESFGNTLTPKTTAGATTGTNRATPIKDAVKKGADQLKKTVDDVNDGLKKAADDVKKALNGDKDNDKGGDSGSTSNP